MRFDTAGGVAVPVLLDVQRLITAGGVAVADSVEKERADAAGGVVTARHRGVPRKPEE